MDASGKGRPRRFETRRRTTEFWRLLAETGSLAASSARSGLDAGRVLRLLDDPQIRAVANALLDMREAA